jgi:TonB family protein
MAPANNATFLTRVLLPEGQRRWGSFGAGLGLEFLVLTALVITPLLMPQKLEVVKQYWVTPIESPIIEPWKPQPVKKAAVVKREVVKKVPKLLAINPPKPKIIYDPVFTSPVAKPVVTRKNIHAPDIAKVFPDRNPSVSLGSSAIPTLKRPREPVQTGGFGDPNGVPDNGKRDRNPNIAHVGAYDMPAGAGYGNGTGGAKGARGVVASAGFGNGVAIGGPGGASHGSVRQGLFGNEKPVAPAPRVKETAASSNTKPVETLFVPRPVYTDEGRAKKIEGDVVLQVIFAATGEVKIQRVVQGLGYGLEEAAATAARHIRFRPAQREGRPVDFGPVNVRIKFALAY